VDVVAVQSETLNTVSGEVAHVIDKAQIDNLALNGRAYTELLTLVPGAVVTNPDQFSVLTSLSATNQVINGHRSNQNNLTVDGVGNLDDYRRDFVTRKRCASLGVSLEELAGRPLDGEIVQAFGRLAEFDRAHDVRVLDPCAERGFAKKTGNGGAVLPELVAQYLQRDGTMRVVGGLVDSGRPTFTDALFKRVAGDISSSKRIA